MGNTAVDAAQVRTSSSVAEMIPSDGTRIYGKVSQWMD